MMKTATAGCDRSVSGSQVHVWSRPQQPWNSDGVHPFIGHPCELRVQEVPYMNMDSTPFTTFLLFFMEVSQLLEAETDKCYNQCLHTLENDNTTLVVIVQERYILFATVIQMGHEVRITLKYYWSTLELFCTPLYSNVMEHDQFFHILRYLHFSNNRNQPDKSDSTYE
jgi:hypothetical protein